MSSEIEMLPFWISGPSGMCKAEFLALLHSELIKPLESYAVQCDLGHGYTITCWVLHYAHGMLTFTDLDFPLDAYENHPAIVRANNDAFEKRFNKLTSARMTFSPQVSIMLDACTFLLTRPEFVHEFI